MTLTPFEQRHKVSCEIGPEYTVPNVCCHPDCSEHNVQRHHLCRRSLLGGAYDWIKYEGVMIQNVVPLCLEHHQLITENKAAILWEELGFFEWVSMDDHDHLFGVGFKLNPHPQIGLTPDVSGGVVETPLADVCPTCKRPHRRKTAKEQVRARKTWTIHVPMDEREDGADVLDTLLDEARKVMAEAGLPYGDEDKARYFVLSAVLGLFVQHGLDVMS